MTNLEMIANSGALNYPIKDATYSVALTKNGLTPSSEYSVNDEKSLELAISDLALTLIFSAKKIMDDGYSVELQDVPSLWKIRRFYRVKWGLDDDTPIEGEIILKDGSFKW